MWPPEILTTGPGPPQSRLRLQLRALGKDGHSPASWFPDFVLPLVRETEAGQLCPRAVGGLPRCGLAWAGCDPQRLGSCRSHQPTHLHSKAPTSSTMRHFYCKCLKARISPQYHCAQQEVFTKQKKRNQKLLSNSQEMFTNRTPNSQRSSFYQSCFHHPLQLCLGLSFHVTSTRLSTAPGPGPVSTDLKHQVGSSCPQRGAWEGRLQCALRAPGWAQARDVPGKCHQNRVRLQGPPPGPGVAWGSARTQALLGSPVCFSGLCCEEGMPELRALLSPSRRGHAARGAQDHPELGTGCPWSAETPAPG